MSLALGAQAPDFELEGVDGREHSLGDYREAELLVLIQSCNHCPYVIAWEDRMIAVQDDYASRGVRLVAVQLERFRALSARLVRADDHPGGGARVYVRLPARSRADARSRSWRGAHARGVRVRPGPPGSSYHGAIDDNRDDTQVAHHYLRDALDAALAGSALALEETPAVGCTVKWLS